MHKPPSTTTPLDPPAPSGAVTANLPPASSTTGTDVAAAVSNNALAVETADITGGLATTPFGILAVIPHKSEVTGLGWGVH